MVFQAEEKRQARKALQSRSEPPSGRRRSFDEWSRTKAEQQRKAREMHDSATAADPWQHRRSEVFVK